MKWYARRRFPVIDPEHPDEPMRWLEDAEADEQDSIDTGVASLTGEPAPRKLVDATGDDPIAGNPIFRRLHVPERRGPSDSRPRSQPPFESFSPPSSRRSGFTARQASVTKRATCSAKGRRRSIAGNQRPRNSAGSSSDLPTPAATKTRGKRTREVGATPHLYNGGQVGFRYGPNENWSKSQSDRNKRALDPRYTSGGICEPWFGDSRGVQPVCSPHPEREAFLVAIPTGAHGHLRCHPERSAPRLRSQ